MDFRKLKKPMTYGGGRQDRGLAKPREYELVVVLSPALDEEESKGTIDRIHGIITGAGGAIDPSAVGDLSVNQPTRDAIPRLQRDLNPGSRRGPQP